MTQWWLVYFFMLVMQFLLVQVRSLNLKKKVSQREDLQFCNSITVIKCKLWFDASRGFHYGFREPRERDIRGSSKQR